MVDFNNEVTIGTPAADVQKISILQRRYDWIEAYEDYKKKKFAGTAFPLSFVRARLLSLFIEIQAMLERKMDVDDYDKLKEVCFESKEEKDIIDAFFTINKFLDELKLTRIDTQRVYDQADIEAENKMKGF